MLFVLGSIFCNVSLSRFVTQTQPPPIAMLWGPESTGISIASLVSGSIRTTVLAPSQATQTEPSPNVVPFGFAGVVIVASTSPVEGSICCTSPPNVSVTQTASGVAAR